MNSKTDAASDGALQLAADDELPATEAETRAHLLGRAQREFAPIPGYFVQSPDKRAANRAGPLAQFVRNGDKRGLLALLFLHAIISSGKDERGWSTTLPLAVWARAFGTTEAAERSSASTAASKVISRLVARKLVARHRAGRARKVTVTLLRPDGSGAAYTRPDGKSDKFFKLHNTFWTDGWHERLDLPAIAMLLVALSERPGFELPTERMPEWYGFSADTAERGLKTLENQGLIHIDKRLKKAPLAPTGATAVNVYTLLDPLASQPPDLNRFISQAERARPVQPTTRSKKATKPVTTIRPEEVR